MRVVARHRRSDGNFLLSPVGATPGRTGSCQACGGAGCDTLLDGAAPAAVVVLGGGWDAVLECKDGRSDKTRWLSHALFHRVEMEASQRRNMTPPPGALLHRSQWNVALIELKAHNAREWVVMSTSSSSHVEP